MSDFFTEVPTVGKHNKIIFQGYLLTYDRTNTSGKKYYRCTKSHCKFRVHTIGNRVVHQVNSHSHEVDPIGNQRIEVVEALKNTALLVPSASPKGLVSSVINGVPLSVKGSLPKEKSLKRTATRVRKANQVHWPIADNVQNIVIPHYMTRYIGNNIDEKFLLADSGNVPNRILIFGREALLSILHETDCIFVDGTFKLSPPMFTQVVVVIAKKRQLAVPLLYCLLQNKAQHTYVEMFRLIKGLISNFQPPAVSCDYELALINAVNSEFPNCVIRGCLFHLGQNILRKIQRCGLQTRFRTDVEFNKNAKMIISLAFLPLQKVADGLQALLATVCDELVPVVTWFRDTYIERQAGGARSQPSFPLHLWSQHERVISGGDRTNNYAEAAHRALYSVLKGNHPHLWSFIDLLKSTQNNRDLSIEHVVSGIKPAGKPLKYKQADERIFNLVSSFNENSNVIEFLRGISHNFTLE